MSGTSQSHSGSGDNVGGNKILNLSFPRLLAGGIIIVFISIAFIYWRSNKERFFFDEDKIDVAITVTDSLQIAGMTEDEALMYTVEDLIYYDLHTSGDTTQIIPSSKYMDKLRHNEELPGETHTGYVQLYSKIPKINFKVTNNSNKTIFFSKIEIDVESSEVDPEPMPAFNVGECFIGESNETLSFQIYNEGWSPMKNVKLNLNVITPEEKVDYGNTPYQVGYETIEKEQLVDLFPILRKQGVDVDRLIACTRDEYGVDIDTALVKTGLAKYVQDTSVIPGSRNEIQGIVYGWVMYNDVNGKPYRLKINMPIAIYREWGCGAAGLETGAYDIALCESGKNYKVVYPLSQYLKASDIDNFGVKLICPKSSIHKMNVKLYYAGNQFIEKQISYHLIVPRRMVEEEVIAFKGNGKCADPNPAQALTP